MYSINTESWRDRPQTKQVAENKITKWINRPLEELLRKEGYRSRGSYNSRHYFKSKDDYVNMDNVYLNTVRNCPAHALIRKSISDQGKILIIRDKGKVRISWMVYTPEEAS